MGYSWKGCDEIAKGGSSEGRKKHPNWKLQSRLGHYREVVSKNKGISDSRGWETNEARQTRAIEMKTGDGGGWHTSTMVPTKRELWGLENGCVDKWAQKFGQSKPAHRTPHTANTAKLLLSFLEETSNSFVDANGDRESRADDRWNVRNLAKARSK